MKKRLPILIWLLAIASALVVIVRTNYVADMSAFLPEKPTNNQSILVEQLTHGSLSRTLLIGIENGSPETLARASNALARIMRVNNAFSTVQNGDPESTRADQAFLFNNRYRLSPTTTEHFSEAGLHQSIADSIDLLASPIGLMIKNIFTQDPTGELISVINNLGYSGQIQTNNGVWMGDGGRRALILAQLGTPGTDTDSQEAAVQFVRKSFDQLRRQIDPSLTLVMAGSPVFSVNARDIIRSQVMIYSMIGILGISCLFLLIFRSFVAFVFAALPILSGVLAGIVAVSLSFGQVHAITIGFGATLIGESIDYAIYYFSQTQKSNTHWRNHFWRTVRIGTLTSVVGFTALLTTEFPGLAQLSVFTIAGLVSALIVARYLLPVIYERPKGANMLPALGNWLVARKNMLARLRYIGYAAALLTLVPFAFNQVQWSQQIGDLSPISASDKEIDRQLRADLGAGGTRHLVVIRASTADAALSLSEQVTEHIAPLVEQKLITGFDAPSKLLPSQQAQRQRIDAIPEPTTLASRLNRAVSTLPVRATTLEPFLASAETSRQSAPLDLDSFKQTSLQELIRSLLYPVGNHWVAIGIAKDSPEHPIDPAALEQTLQRAAIPGVHYVDLLNESNQMYTQYVSGTLTSCFVGGLAMFLLLSLALRSFRSALLILLPLALSTMIVAAVLGIAGVKLTLLHAVGFLLIFAIGSNYTLFLSIDKGEMDPVTIASLVVACLSTMIGFGVLAFTDVPVLRAMGQTVAPGVLLSLIFALSMTAAKHHKPPSPLGKILTPKDLK